MLSFRKKQKLGTLRAPRRSAEGAEKKVRILALREILSIGRNYTNRCKSMKAVEIYWAESCRFTLPNLLFWK